MATARIAGLAIALVATGVAVGITTSCAGPGIQIMSTSKNDESDPIARGYDVGYDHGRADSMRGAKPDPTMPGNQKNADTVAAYSRGYGDGYSGRSNRHGSVESRDWMHQDTVPTVSDYNDDNTVDDR